MDSFKRDLYALGGGLLVSVSCRNAFNVLYFVVVGWRIIAYFGDPLDPPCVEDFNVSAITVAISYVDFQVVATADGRSPRRCY